MYTAIASLTFLGLLLGALLGLAARYFKVESDPVVDEVDAMLPGSNCGQCGYAGCGQAAEAMVSGDAAITICPPGGKALVEELSKCLGIEVDTSAMEDDGPKIARVDESLCIGCIKCFRVCPTDAIVGAPKQIHTVMDMACTGCGACIDICPTECLTLVPPEPTLQSWHWPKPETAQAA